MKFKLGSGLLWVDSAALLLLIMLWTSWDTPRFTFGVPALLVFPGYTLLLALLPGQSDLKGVERFGLSLGVSLAISGLAGVILNYTPWGITLESISYSLAGFIGFTSLVAFVRRRRLEPEERYNLEFNVSQAGWYRWLLGIAIIGTTGLLAYALTSPKLGESYTEFYILGSQGQAADYPRQLKAGEESTVTLGVVNHEHRIAEYRVEVRLDGLILGRLDSFELGDGQTREQRLSFAVAETGESRQLQFLLFKDGDSSPYRELHLFIDVS